MSTAFTRTTRSLAADHGRPALWAWGLAALALAGWGTWFLRAEVTLYQASPRARLEARDAAHTLATAVAGRLVSNRLVLGAAVRQGELLAELDAAIPAQRLQEAQARQTALAAQAVALRGERATREQSAAAESAAAQAALQSAGFRSEEASVASRHASEAARRLAEDSTAGGTAPADAERARADAEQRLAALRAAEAETRRLAAEAQGRDAARRAELEALQRAQSALNGSLAESAAQVARLQLELAQHQLRAPVAGRVAAVEALHAGDSLAAGQALARIVPDDGGFIVVADFDPAAVLGRVHPGQPATLRLEGYPWAQYGAVAATVSRVAGEVKDQRIRVELTPRPPWPRGVVPQHGLPGSVEVNVGQATPARLLLRAAGQALADSPEPP